VSRPSNITNKETIGISITIIESDFKALFLFNISIRKERERLTISVLLNIRCRLSAVIDY
jgi:hypothetical protein